MHILEDSSTTSMHHVSDISTDKFERTSKLYICSGVAFVLIAYCAHAFSYIFLNDDAYISMRYAHHWAHHGEIVYNLGERVEGYTNFLWVAILAGVIKLGGAAPLWSLILISQEQSM